MAEAQHLVLGDHGAALLRLAIEKHGMPGTVWCIPDDLSHGPLDNGRKRIAYMRACYSGFADWDHTGTDAFAPWRKLAAELERSAHPVVVWAGDNASEGTLLAMACWWLKGRAEQLSRVAPDRRRGRHVGTRAPKALATMLSQQCKLTPRTITEQANVFERLSAQRSLLRRWQIDRVADAPLDAFDARLLRGVSTRWRRAARVVGEAMGVREPMSDLFYASRLQALIALGRIEADRAPRRLRDYAVRLVQS